MSTATALVALAGFVVNFCGCNDSDSELRDSKQTKSPEPFRLSERTTYVLRMVDLSDFLLKRMEHGSDRNCVCGETTIDDAN